MPSPKGVTVVADNLRTNGIAFSPDDKILYVTNGDTLVAFDVQGPGMLANRRDFAMLLAGSNGDGTAVDSEGTPLCEFQSRGAGLRQERENISGLIPTPRGIISVAFAGPDEKDTLRRRQRRGGRERSTDSSRSAADGRDDLQAAGDRARSEGPRKISENECDQAGNEPYSSDPFFFADFPSPFVVRVPIV